MVTICQINSCKLIAEDNRDTQVESDHPQIEDIDSLSKKDYLVAQQEGLTSTRQLPACSLQIKNGSLSQPSGSADDCHIDQELSNGIEVQYKSKIDTPAILGTIVS